MPSVLVSRALVGNCTPPIVVEPGIGQDPSDDGVAGIIGGAEQDPVVDLDVEDVHREGEVVHRREHHPAAEVHRRLLPQWLGPEDPRGPVGHREIADFHQAAGNEVRGDVTEPALRQARRAETGAGGGAEDQLLARLDADCCLPGYPGAEVAVVLVAAGDVQEYLFGEIRLQVEIGTHVVP